MSQAGRPTYNVVKIPGDGIGPEIVEATSTVLDAAAETFGFDIAWTEVLAGGIAIDAYGEAVRDEDLEVMLKSDAVFLGAVGGPKWDDIDPAMDDPVTEIMSDSWVQAVTDEDTMSDEREADAGRLRHEVREEAGRSEREKGRQ